jgi:glutamyl-tRNA synthetase
LASEAQLASRREWYHELLNLLRVRARTIDDIVRQAGPYFLDEIAYDPEAVAKQWKDPVESKSILQATAAALTDVKEWNLAALEESLRSLAESRGISAGKIFQPLRVALTGMTVSPGIFEVLALMGRERSLKRIQQALTVL